MSSGQVRKAALDGVFKKAGGRAEVLQNVQCLRAASAILVIFAHVDGLLVAIGSLPRQPLANPFFGTAVAVFFTISGFIMVYTSSNRRITPLRFMANRITRIVPIYWAVTLFLFALALMLPNLVQATRADPSELVKSLLFIPFAKSNGVVEPLLFVGWTLNYEMIFYLIFAAGLWCKNRVIGMGCVILTLLGLVVFGIIAQPVNVVLRFYSSSLVLEFVGGMVIALLLPLLPLRGTRTLCVTALVFMVVGIAGAATIPFLAPEGPFALVCGLPTVLLFAGAVALDRWEWQIRNVTWLLLGEASYSLYLTHSFVTQAVEKFGRYTGATGLFALVLVAIALVASCLVGIVVYRLIEKPLWQMARRRLLASRLWD